MVVESSPYFLLKVSVMDIALQQFALHQQACMECSYADMLICSCHLKSCLLVLWPTEVTAAGLHASQHKLVCLEAAMHHDH